MINEIYMSPNGSDAASGSMDAPIKTFDEAKKRVAQIAEGEVEVILRGGEYFVDKTICFGLDDGGSENKKVTYKAFENETPVLTSGVPVENWAKEGAFWVAPIPKGVNKVLNMYHGDAMLMRSRSDAFHVTKKIKYNRVHSLNIREDEDRTLLRRVDFPKGMLVNCENLCDIELRFMPVPWTMNMRGIESVDEDQCVAMLTTEATAPLCAKPLGMYVENDIRYMKKGMWCVNTLKRKIYYMPEDDQCPTDIYVPTQVEFIHVEGQINYDDPADIPVKNLHFKGLEFKHSARYVEEHDYKGGGIQHDWEMFDRSTAVMRFRGAEDCSVRECYFHSTSNTALRGDLHCQRIIVENNMFDRIGNIGIMFCGYGPGTKDVCHHNVIRNNIITRTGEEIWHGQCIVIWQSGYNLIEHNRIHHAARKGIEICGVRITILQRPQHTFDEAVKSIRWNEINATIKDCDDEFEKYLPYLHSRNNIIRYNDVSKLLMKLADGAAINISGAGEGNDVINNFVHHMSGLNSSNAMRTDDWQRGTLFRDNVIYMCNGSGIIRKNYNHVINNIFADLSAKNYMRFASYPNERKHYGSKVQHNIFYDSIGNVDFFGEGYLVSPEATYPKHCIIEDNLYFCKGEPDNHSVSEHLKKYPQVRPIVADPMFVDYSGKDFTLKEESPALKAGFQQIDISKVGVTDEYPKRLLEKEYYCEDHAEYHIDREQLKKEYEWW